MEKRLKTFYQIGLALVLGLILIILLDKSIPIITKFMDFFFSLSGPFIAGFVLAYLLSGLVDYLERKGIKRMFAVILVFFGLIAIFSLIINALIPILKTEIDRLIRYAPTIWRTLDKWLAEIYERFDFIPNKYHYTLEEIWNHIVQDMDFRPKIKLSEIFNVFALVFLVPISTLYFLFEFNQIKRAIKRFLLRQKRYIFIRYLKELDRGMSRYLKGLIIIIHVLGLTAAIAFMIVGLDYALLFGLIIGYFDIIPYVGPWFGAAPAVLYAFSQDVRLGILVLIIAIALQLFQNNILTPFIQGRATQIRPFYILISLFLCGRLFGVFGMIFAVPILYFLILTTRYIIRFLRLRSIHKLDPTWFSPIAKKEEEHV